MCRLAHLDRKSVLPIVAAIYARAAALARLSVLIALAVPTVYLCKVLVKGT
jgi:hypothetical protein